MTAYSVIEHTFPDCKIAETQSEHIIISNAEDGLQLMGDLYYQGFDAIVIPIQNITPSFFDLQNGLAGEILQKFSNYRIKLAIAGDFLPYTTRKSVADFIYESNKKKQIVFASSTETALELLK